MQNEVFTNSILFFKDENNIPFYYLDDNDNNDFEKNDNYIYYGRVNAYFTKLFNNLVQYYTIKEGEVGYITEPNFEKRLEEIENLDVNKLSIVNKTIIYAITSRLYRLDKEETILEHFIKIYPNLEELKYCKPLKNPVKLVEYPLGFKEYKEMNLLY